VIKIHRHNFINVIVKRDSKKYEMKDAKVCTKCYKCFIRTMNRNQCVYWEEVTYDTMMDDIDETLNKELKKLKDAEESKKKVKEYLSKTID
jgi:hypothetical protein